MVGDDPSSIASGLTAPDTTTLEDTRRVLERYRIYPPESIATHLRDAEETPATDDPVFEDVVNVICGGGRHAAEAAAKKAEELGYAPLLLTTTLTGDALGAASMYAAIVREVLASGNPVSSPCAIVSGGEATVTVRGGGDGGPNQEFALALAVELDGVEGWAAFSADTDGHDGSTEAAGGIVDGQTAQRIRDGGVDPGGGVGGQRFFSGAPGRRGAAPHRANGHQRQRLAGGTHPLSVSKRLASYIRRCRISRVYQLRAAQPVHTFLRHYPAGFAVARLPQGPYPSYPGIMNGST